MPNNVEIAQTVAEIWLFFDFQHGGRRHLGFVKFLTVGTDKRVELHHLAKFRQNRLNCGWDITISRFFHDGGRPPSWICNSCVGTVHEGHLVAFIDTGQNVVGIDAVVLIICTFFDFASLAWKRLFTPQNWGFSRGKLGKGWSYIDPQRTRSYFWGFTRLCPIWWKSTKKCDRKSVHRRTHTHTHGQTQNDFIICPMLYAIAMGQIKIKSTTE